MTPDQHAKLYPGSGQDWEHEPVYPISAQMARAHSALERQEGGAHYASMKIQPIEYAVANRLGPCETLALKYISRHRAKHGAKDIRKAIHVLELLL